jgi:periplasmic protein TonB
LLERAKHYLESALRRGARGTAKIRFSIDKSGGVASVSVLRSSGQADLDLEGVALARRASPFPPPPAGTKRSFAIEVAFGDGQ